MKHLKLFIRNFKVNWKSSSLKIITLGIGLAFGLILLAKIFFDHSYNRFYQNLDQLYLIEQGFQAADKPELKRIGVSGGIAPGMKEEVPGVEAATRMTGIGKLTFNYGAEDKFNATVILADSCFYDVLPRPMLEGNAKEALSVVGKVIISSSLADNMGGNVVGKAITFEQKPDYPLVIEGVFRDVPYNSSFKYDIIVSLPSIGAFMGDGSNNWIGNDRYVGLVKLSKSIDPSSLSPAIRAMQEKHQDMDYFQKYNIKLTYYLAPLKDYHQSQDSVKHQSIVLGTIAFVLLLVCIINYVMLTTLTVISKSKEIALHKCYGAVKKDIIKMVYWETFFYILCSLILFSMIILASRQYIDQLIGEQISILFSVQMAFSLLGVCGIIFVLTGVLPAYFYLRLPSLHALKNNRKMNRMWKLLFLFIQFVGVAALFAFLLQIEVQYRGILKEDLGYKYENLLYTSFSSPDIQQRMSVIGELKKLTCVEGVTTGSEYPFMWPSGNNVLLPNSDKELFNIGDFYYVQSNYLNTMGIELIEGENFHEGSQRNDILVSDDFLLQLQKHIDVSNGVIGKEVIITEHGLSRIIGVYKRLKLTSILNPDKRATVIYHKSDPQSVLFIKLNEFTPENKMMVDRVLRQTMHDEEVGTAIYKETIEGLYSSTKQLQKIIILGGIIAFIFAVVGLIGYTQSEVKRRSKEIALRKINGASFKNLMLVLSQTSFRLALPAILIGLGLSYFLVGLWMRDFDFQLLMPIYYYLLVGVFVMLLIMSITFLQLKMIVRMNPIDALQSE